jgi:mono/diheme cytochrome c family protein
LTDSSVVRALRYGISRQGRTLAPFMSLANTSDEDLVAILSYLRSLAPVVHQVRPTRLSWVGAFGLRYFLAPQEPTQKPSKSVMPARSAEYGRYLANTIANCHGCHTRRSKLTGAFTGLPFAGGMTFEEPTGKFVAPDLRQAVDAPLACKSEHDFIAKFRVPGRGLSGSPMPWEAFARMTDDDLGSIYLYLKTLPIGLARMPVALPAAARQSARDPAVASLRRWLHFEPAGNGGCSERSPRH